MASNKIKEIIKTLSDFGFKNVISFGDITPHSPYVVVKPEKDPLARGTIYRIISHRGKSQQVKLDQDIHDIITLLETKLEYTSEDFNPEYIPNSDDSLSRENTFLMVSKY